jgi:hypothetical protein
MRFSLNLIDSDAEINNKILDILKQDIESAIKKSVPGIKNRIREELKKALMSEPEYSSLVSGQLRLELGIPTAQYVDNIIDIWINNVTVEYNATKSSSKGLSGGFSINMIRESFDDVLGSSTAVIIDANTGSSVPWLEWLLLYGGKMVVKNYNVKLGANPNSRTGMAVMVQSSSSWRVPPEFAGTASNNWVTRALKRMDDSILSIMQSEVEKYI